MNIYLVSRTDESDFNQDRDKVVVAEDEQSARTLTLDKYDFIYEGEHCGDWISESMLNSLYVEFLGISSECKERIILVRSTGA